MPSPLPRSGGPDTRSTADGRTQEHIVLLGDSILDNRAYTAGEPDVVTHLRTLLPEGWQATLCAVDGATTDRLEAQLPHVPRDGSHLVIAIGGNDALQNIDLLDRRVSSTGEALALFGERLTVFSASYGRALDAAIGLGRRVTICTIYNGALPGETGRLARIGVSMFNDAILRSAFERSVGVIELRAICTEPEDYANPIEPSGRGGLKIARAIARATGAATGVRPPSAVWAQP